MDMGDPSNWAKFWKHFTMAGMPAMNMGERTIDVWIAQVMSFWNQLTYQFPFWFYPLVVIGILQAYRFKYRSYYIQSILIFFATTIGMIALINFNIFFYPIRFIF